MVALLEGGRAQAVATEVARFLTALPSLSGEVTALRITGEDSRPVMISPKDGEKVSILVEENAEATIIEEGSGRYCVEILVRPNAQLRYYGAVRGAQVTRHAIVQDDARILWVDAASDGTRSDVVTLLSGKGADAQYRSVVLGKDAESTEVRSSMLHHGDKSTSNMLTRAVLLGRSKGKYEGLIRIHHAARGCDAYQKEETLLLSEHAHMDATPNLEISNEDVRCSHGVSLGQIDEEKMFYLLSRGISRKDAIRLIVTGFFDEVLAPMGEARARIIARLGAVA